MNTSCGRQSPAGLAAISNRGVGNDFAALAIREEPQQDHYEQKNGYSRYSHSLSRLDDSHGICTLATQMKCAAVSTSRENSGAAVRKAKEEA